MWQSSTLEAVPQHAGKSRTPMGSEDLEAGVAALRERLHGESLKLILCGSFGLGNIGDEALPYAVSDLARAYGLDLQLNLLSRYDQPLLANAIGLRAPHRDYWDQLRGQPCLIIGGGIISPDKLSVLFRCAPTLRKIAPSLTGLFAVAVETGVRYPFLTRRRIRRLLRGINPLYARDVPSAATLGRIVGRHVTVTGDSVLWLKADDELPEGVLKADRFIAVSLRDHWAGSPGWYAWISRQLKALSERLHVPLVFVPFSWLQADDRLEHRKVCEVLHFLAPEVQAHCIDAVLTPRQAAGILKRAVLTVGMRLHACVMSYAQRVPFVAVAYHPKIRGFAETVGWEMYVTPSNLPFRQSTRAYGYAFPDVKLNEQLEGLAVDALTNGKFNRLDPLRERVARAFMGLVTRTV